MRITRQLLEAIGLTKNGENTYMFEWNLPIEIGKGYVRVYLGEWRAEVDVNNRNDIMYAAIRERVGTAEDLRQTFRDARLDGFANDVTKYIIKQRRAEQ